MGNASLILDPPKGAATGRRRKVRGVSLSPDHDRALTLLAAHDGHDNASRVIQDLIEREMRARFGRDWRENTEAA